MITRILSIAGSDSGGGAGIQADIRTITRLGGHAMTAVTAITAQNSVGVNAVLLMDADMVVAQIDAVIQDFGVDAIKIGMAGSSGTVLAIAKYISTLKAVPIIFDPVMVASSGAQLASDEVIDAFEALMQSATLITPNIPEFERLSQNITMKNYPCDVLIKGGHGDDHILTDRLMRRGQEIYSWEGDRIDTQHNHGTGCTLSAAIATYMGRGDDVVGAIDKARNYVRASLQCTPNIGAGHGPMGVPSSW